MNVDSIHRYDSIVVISKYKNYAGLFLGGSVVMSVENDDAHKFFYKVSLYDSNINSKVKIDKIKNVYLASIVLVEKCKGPELELDFYSVLDTI